LARTDYDVIVVGAGPAGATAAKRLGESGISTLVLDKSAFPREKPCGGGISARVLKRFPYLDHALANIPTKWISRVYFESPAGFAVEYESPERLYLMIRRVDFDNLLLSLAEGKVDCVMPALVRKIARTSSGFRVTAGVGDECFDYQCKLLLGCDGANSIVARAAGFRNGNVRGDFAIDMMEETPAEELRAADSDTMRVYYRIGGKYGYGYVFPKAGYLNLGIGFKMDYYLEELRGRQYAFHQNFVEELGLKNLVAGKSNPDNFRAFPLPLSGPLPLTYSDGVLLAGDAGGFVNGFTAEGIYYAMVSGDLAGKAAVAAVQTNRFARDQVAGYQRSWEVEIGEELRKSVAIQRRLLQDESRVDRLVHAAARNPVLADLLARYATGAIGHAAFKRAMFWRAFPAYLREKLQVFARHSH
jgi:geranylgeranyl reductase family protein